LKTRAAEIEAAFGSKLDWVPGEHSRIRLSTTGGYLDQDEWPVLLPRLAETMARLVAAIDPALSTLKSRPATGRALGDDEDEDEVSA
jgi:hypothetical protein